MRGTILADFAEQARSRPDRVALRSLAAGGAAADRSWSWSGWQSVSRSFAAALVHAGAASGERVAILAGNRPVWPFADIGALMAGCVSVGLYPTSSPPQVREVLRDSGARVLVVDTAEQLRKVMEAVAELPALRAIVLGDGMGVERQVASLAAGVSRRDAHRQHGTDGEFASPAALSGGPELIRWPYWIERGERALGRVADELERRLAAASPGELAGLIYTSGSTGEPKGARIPHAYVTASADSIRTVLGLGPSDTSLSFLPYCHAGERVFGLYTRIRCGMEAGLVEDASRVWEAAKAYGPTVFGGVPRFFEKAYETLRSEHVTSTGAERERWDRVIELGRARSESIREGRGVDPTREDEWRRLGEPVFERARGLFGGRLRIASSGGAPLPREAVEYLDALGVTVLGAYGLTEHLCAAFNRPAEYSFDTAGPPMPGTEIRISGEGEIQLRRSALTFGGYHGKPEASRAAFTDDGEWVRTGDLGSLDGRGFLRVEGRLKELIALSTGKKVAPAPIEALLKRDPWIAEAVLFGEGRKFVSALIVLRRREVEGWAAEAGIDLDYRGLLQHPSVIERVEEAVEEVNSRLSSSERVRRFVLLDHELTADAGELTPTLKVRRPVVAGRYAERLEALYR